MKYLARCFIQSRIGRRDNNSCFRIRIDLKHLNYFDSIQFFKELYGIEIVARIVRFLLLICKNYKLIYAAQTMHLPKRINL